MLGERIVNRRALSSLGVVAYLAVLATARPPRASPPPPPFTVLNPAAFRGLLADDFDWAVDSVPFFEAEDANLTRTYYFRTRVLRAHIVPTGLPALPWAITEFMPNVSWAGRANTIPCAAGHHLSEARWLRGAAAAVADSYSAWWAAGLPGVKSNYYSFYAWSLARRLDVAGLAANLPLVAALLPNASAQARLFMDGTLPGGGGSAYSAPHGCVWNAPGNEGQELALSGDGCRPLVQALLHGEAATLSTLWALVGNASAAAEFAARAAGFRNATLALWNAGIESFDTLRMPRPEPPPPPAPPGFKYFAADSFCCDQAPCAGGRSAFLFEGALPVAACAAKCADWPGGAAHFITVSASGWCQVAEWCNTTNPFAGEPAMTYRLDAPAAEGRSGLPAAAPPPAFSGVRELASLTSPWLFGAVPAGRAADFGASWAAAFDADGLSGPRGLRTAEARAPGYTCAPGFCCSWAGPVWPFETSKALTAAAGVLQDAAVAPGVPALTRARYWAALSAYTAQHTGAWAITDGAGVRANYSAIAAAGLFMAGVGDAWIAEAGCAESGEWTDDWREGYRYLHSSYVDIVIGGVAGVVPRGGVAAPSLTVLPLQPSDDALSWWALDGAVVAGRVIAVAWDARGTRYGVGAGLSIFVDGARVAHADTTQLGAVGLYVPL